MAGSPSDAVFRVALATRTEYSISDGSTKTAWVARCNASNC